MTIATKAIRMPSTASRSLCRNRHQVATSTATRASAHSARVITSTGSVLNGVTQVTACAMIVGSDSQLMIFFEPDSAVSQPIPTPAMAEAATNTTAKTPSPSPAILANIRAGLGLSWDGRAASSCSESVTCDGSSPARWAARRSFSCNIQIHTRKGSAIPAVALMATPIATTTMPATW